MKLWIVGPIITWAAVGLWQWHMHYLTVEGVGAYTAGGMLGLCFVVAFEAWQRQRESERG